VRFVSKAKRCPIGAALSPESIKEKAKHRDHGAHGENTQQAIAM